MIRTKPPKQNGQITDITKAVITVKKKRETIKPRKFACNGNRVYQRIFVEHVFRLNLLGATIPELADFFRVTPAVIHRWRKKYPEFGEAFEKGKSIADSRVVESLYRRALGYSHPEEKVFINRGRVVRETVMKHYPPDTHAATFWLKNRRRGEWKDRHEHEVVPQRVLDSVKLEKVDDSYLSEVIKLAGGPEFEEDWEDDE